MTAPGSPYFYDLKRRVLKVVCKACGKTVVVRKDGRIGPHGDCPQRQST